MNGIPGGQGEAPPITLNDVARAAGVSATTVSHVINGTRFVAPATTERVMWAIEQLRYEVNFNARNLKTGRSQVIGVLISDVTNPHFSGVVRGVEDVATRAGYQMILCNTDEDPDKELTYLRMLRSKGVDGALMVPTGVRHDYMDHLVQAAFPLVFVDRVLPDVPCDAVLADNVGGAHAAVSHLIRLGHQRIGVTCSAMPTPGARKASSRPLRCLTLQSRPPPSSPPITSPPWARWPRSTRVAGAFRKTSPWSASATSSGRR